jgi:hypothetical protein
LSRRSRADPRAPDVGRERGLTRSGERDQVTSELHGKALRLGDILAVRIRSSP